MKTNTQFYIVTILSKLILALTILFGTENSIIPKGEYNFLTLFGTLVFIISFSLEIIQKNYVLGFFAISGIIIFQPIFSVLKKDSHPDSIKIYINQDLLHVLFLVISIWIIYDIVILIKVIKKNKINSN